MKIVYLLPGGLFNSGGMERAVTVKANYLADVTDYDIHIVTTEQMGRPVFYPLSEKVSLHHLDIGMYENFGKESYLQKAASRSIKNRKYRRLLEQLLCEIRPDITITTLGGLDIEFINDLQDGSVKIGELHFPGNFRQLMAAKLSNRFIPNLVAKIRTRIFRKKCNQLARLVVLTAEEMNSWKNCENKTVIPNPVSFYPEHSAALVNKQVIAVGRLAYEKGFDMLIDAWRLVADKHPDWRLNIFGNGNCKEALLRQIEERELKGHVTVCEAVSDIYQQYLEHSALAFSSRYLEALPMVLLEAQSCGLPIVAFDAPCGPKDLIDDAQNGFLVPTGDIEKLAERIIQIIDSPRLRQEMGQAAKNASESYRLERIMQKWIDLFNILTKQ